METITKTYNLYSFDELSEDAKSCAKDNITNEYWAEWIFSDAHETLVKFCDIFNIDYRNIDYLEPYRNEYTIKQDEDILNLSGLRLHKYLINNYYNQLFEPKYLKCFDEHKNHRNIKNHTAQNTKKEYSFYYSSLKLDNSCVLTGMCYDMDILDPIYDFLQKPNNQDFETLLNDCIYSLCHSVSSEYEATFEDDYISEHCAANDYQFLEDGEIF